MPPVALHHVHIGAGMVERLLTLPSLKFNPFGIAVPFLEPITWR